MESFEDKIRALYNQKQKQMIPELNDMERQYFKEKCDFYIEKICDEIQQGLLKIIDEKNGHPNRETRLKNASIFGNDKGRGYKTIYKQNYCYHWICPYKIELYKKICEYEIIEYYIGDHSYDKRMGIKSCDYQLIEYIIKNVINKLGKENVLAEPIVDRFDTIYPLNMEKFTKKNNDTLRSIYDRYIESRKSNTEIINRFNIRFYYFI